MTILSRIIAGSNASSRVLVHDLLARPTAYRRLNKRSYLETTVGASGAAVEWQECYSIFFRDCLARAAPMAVVTSFSSSGGGITAGNPSASIHNSRVQPVV
jgi:hypothetical protein